MGYTYFSKKQYFKDTTAPEGLAEFIPFQSVPAVKPKQTKFPQPQLIEVKDDYFGNKIYTYKDISGQIRKVSLMVGANKPRGAAANVKWSMAPNRFRRGRGLQRADGFIEPIKRRNETTEFFKSRYQSAYGEMLINQKIKEADKLSGKKTKVLKKELKEKNDKITALIQSNTETERRLRDENKRDLDTLRLQLGQLNNGGMRGGGEYSGAGVGLRDPPDSGATGTGSPKGKGGGKGGKGKPPPPPPPKRQPTTEEIEKEQEARRAAARLGGGADETPIEQINRLSAGGLLTPSQLKKIRQDEKEQKKAKLKAGGDAPPLVGGAQPEAETSPDIGTALQLAGAFRPPSPLSPPPADSGETGGFRPVSPPKSPSAEEEREKIAKRRREVGRGKSAEPDSPRDLVSVPSGGTAASTAPSAISGSDTPRTREKKLKFFGRRGGQLEEVDIAKLDKEGVKAVVDSTAFNPEEKKEILKGLSGKMPKGVREEAEKQLRILSGEIGETAEATIGGEKQTATPRPPLEDPEVVINPIDLEDTEDEAEPEIEPAPAPLAKTESSEERLGELKSILENQQRLTDIAFGTAPAPKPPSPKKEISGNIPVGDSAELQSISADSDSKGDYFDNLQIYNQQRVAEGKAPFSASIIDKLVSNYPKRVLAGTGTKPPAPAPVEPPDVVLAKKRIANKDRQIEQLKGNINRNYPSVKLGDSNKKKLISLLADVQNEAQFDRGVFDINNLLQLQGKQQLRKDVIRKVKGDKFV